jgi:hypothetical protein
MVMKANNFRALFAALTPMQRNALMATLSSRG